MCFNWKADDARFSLEILTFHDSSAYLPVEWLRDLLGVVMVVVAVVAAVAAERFEALVPVAVAVAAEC